VSGRTWLGENVFDAALGRLTEEYQAGNRLVVSISGGKDSTCCTELAIIAARQAGRLPVEVVIRDEEIMFPGTYEYVERLAERPEVSMTWLVAHQPIINAFDREQPYWWVCDPLLDPSEWVRQPPPWHTEIEELNIQAIVNPKLFAPPDGLELRAVLGLRAEESRGRMMGVHTSGGYLTKANRWGVRNIRPIYDWTDADVWLAIRKHGWDYSDAYNVMHRFGLKPRDLRTSPPTMNPAGGDTLRRVGSVAWPAWWDRVCRRLPSVRTYAQYGKRAVMADRRTDETWEGCYQRTCIDTAPAWIAERAEAARIKVLHRHAHHSTTPLPQAGKCLACGVLGSWKKLTETMYGGDPFSLRVTLPYVDPERFRPGSGYWNGPPSF
jgi:predicted phosphoadenosine phosphosulfate sulfurtransferase